MPIRNYTDNDFLPFLEMLNKSNLYGNEINQDQAKHILDNTIADCYHDLFLAYSSEQLVGFGMGLCSKDHQVNDQSFILRMLPNTADETILLDKLITLLEHRIIESSRNRRLPRIIRSYAFMDQLSIINALEQNRYVFNCYTVRMEMTDFSKLQNPELPEGFSFIPFDPNKDLDRVVEITEQLSNPPLLPGSLSREEFIRKHYNPWFQPELVSLLVHQGTIKGYVWVGINNKEGSQQSIAGYIRIIGLISEIRNNKFRLELIRQAAKTLRDQGCTLIHLNIHQLKNKDEVSKFNKEGFETRYIQFDYYKRED